MKTKRFSAFFIALLLFALPGLQCLAAEGEGALPAAVMVTDLPCRSAILIEPESGRVLYEKDADSPYPPASITKIMTMLLVMEAVDSGQMSLNDSVICSEHASSMGGTQIWFEPGEQMTVHELLKATAVASANDAAVALAEQVAGSEEGFAALMNRRAGELGMKNASFKNASGLDQTDHLCSARDIAIMSAELLKHKKITEYTTIWIDYLRNGETQLVNTNKLVRFFKGATGLKTGTTDGAGYCLAASAERDGLPLVAVVLGADSSDDRFGAARTLLEYGFANFSAMPVPEPEPVLSEINVSGGVKRSVALKALPPASMLCEKGGKGSLKQLQELSPQLAAPVEKGQRVGTIKILSDGILLCEYAVVTDDEVQEMTLLSALKMTFYQLVRMGDASPKTAT